MSCLRPLADLAENESARVVRLDTGSRLLQRFTDLGLIEGTRVRCLHRRRGMAAYLIRGAVIAVRQTDCTGILTVSEAMS